MAFAQPPRIDRISPGEGPIAGTTIVTVSGANFSGASIAVDRQPVAPLSRSDAELRLQMPSHDNGYALIAVTSQSGTAYGRFLYVPPPLATLAPGAITTVAGVGAYAGEYGPATEAMINPMTVTFFDGDTYVAEPPSNRVVRITRDGLLIPFAGNGFSNGLLPAAPADPLSVAINFPRSAVFDGRGNAYIGDSSYLLWRVDRATGLIETIAGTGRSGFAGENVVAKNAAIGLVSFVAADVDGTVYFIDFTNARIRRIDTNGVMSTYVGTGSFGFSGDNGPANQAQFNLRYSDEGALSLDPEGNLYIADTGNRRIRRVDKKTGVITSLENTDFQGVSLQQPRGVAASADGRLAFSSGAQVFEYRDGRVAARYGAAQGYTEAGTPLDAVRFSFAPAVAFDPQGNIVVTDVFNRHVWRLNRVTNRLENIVGIGPAILNEKGRAIEAVLAIFNGDIAWTPGGNLLLADIGHRRLRTIDRAGNIETLALTFDPPAPPLLPGGTFVGFSIEAADTGAFDLATWDSSYAISAERHVRRTAGNGSPNCGFSGDGGPALSAAFCQSWDAVRDRSGNLVVADTNNNRVRRVDALTGTISTIAGSGPTNGNERYGQGSTCGDGGAATDACVNTPYGLVYDDEGNLYVSENEERIRKVDPAGIITTFATGRCSKLTFWHEHLYAVSGPQLVRYRKDGSRSVLAGTGTLGFSGDGGPATAAKIFELKQSAAVAIDDEGNIYFNDGDNLRVRAIRYGAVLAPANATITAAATGGRITASVHDALGHPAPSVRVDFSAPASGASCTLSSPFAITDWSGVATVTCTPNCTPGTYSVTAQPLTALSKVSMSFTNENVPCRRRSVRH